MWHYNGHHIHTHTLHACIHIHTHTQCICTALYSCHDMYVVCIRTFHCNTTAWYIKCCCYKTTEKIRWAKLSRIPSNVVFHGKNFCGALRLQHLNNAIIQSLYKDSRKNFRGALENHEKRERLAQ